MRFLKNKIYLSQQLKMKNERKNSSSSSAATTIGSSTNRYDEETMSNFSSDPRDYEGSQYTKCMGSPKTPEKIRCTKNIVKNYGRVIAKFACSEISLPYLIPILNEKGVSYSDSMAFFTKAKTKIQGIDTFRALVLVTEEDNPKEAAFKEVFQRIGEVFIKYFSVNWIFHSKILHRGTYLKYRFKMLRRLQNPELFTYLKG